MNTNKNNFCLTCLITCLVLFMSQLNFSYANEGTESSVIKIERHFIFDTVPLNLEEITSEANRIFTGTCTNIEELEEDLESKLPVVKYTFKISEAIKGLEGKEEITFKQWKPTVRDAGYEKGEKYILFLYADSEKGLTSPVGFLQGQFDVENKGFIRKKEVVKNKTSNKGLNRNLKTQKKLVINEDQYINDYVNECSELGIPIRYQEFVKAVKYLVKRNK